MPGALTLPAARLLETLGTQRGLAQPLMQTIKTMEGELAEKDLVIQGLVAEVENVRPGCIKNTFSLGFAICLIIVGFGMYYEWLSIELHF